MTRTTREASNEDMAEPGTSFTGLLAEARADPNILGFMLGGSRGKGCETPGSDYDCYVVVRDEVLGAYRERYEKLAEVDLRPMSLGEFRDYAEPGDSFEWDRYNFAHLTVDVDKLDGGIQALVERKGSLSEAEARDAMIAALDGWINSVYRSVKNHRDGRSLESHLDAVEGLSHMLTAVFAAEGRVRPYNKYLRWELQRYPLRALPSTSEDFLRSIDRILRTGDIPTQQELLRGMEGEMTQRGASETIEAWGDEYASMLAYTDPGRGDSARGQLLH
jgi:predicted nucleotidyltransferase